MELYPLAGMMTDRLLYPAINEDIFISFYTSRQARRGSRRYVISAVGR